MGLDDISIRRLRPLSIHFATDISPVYYSGNGFFGWWTGIGRKKRLMRCRYIYGMATSARTELAYRDRAVMRVIAGKIEAAS
jgi:hypothetical protein